jgi:hypothetical protein
MSLEFNRLEHCADELRKVDWTVEIWPNRTTSVTDVRKDGWHDVRLL